MEWHSLIRGRRSVPRPVGPNMSHLVTKPTKWPVRPAKTDQPGYPPRLTRVFAVRMKKAWVLSYPLSSQWSESSLGTHAILLVLSRGGSYLELSQSSYRVRLWIATAVIATAGCWMKIWAASWQKPTKWPLRPAENPISLGICPFMLISVFAMPSIGRDDPRCLHVDSVYSDQTGWMPRLIWVFARGTGHFVGFVMLWLIFKCLCFLLCYYCKKPKNLDTRKICGNHPEIWTRWLSVEKCVQKMRMEWQIL